jgi:hypothetical protein
MMGSRLSSRTILLAPRVPDSRLHATSGHPDWDRGGALPLAARNFQAGALRLEDVLRARDALEERSRSVIGAAGRW